MEGTSVLKEKLSRGEFIVTAEIAPPKSASAEDFIARAEKMKGFADAYNVTDNQTAMVRLSSLAGSVMCLRMGMEPIMQIVCRDRNRIAMQSDVLGAHALGIRNILCLSGDHQSFGNQPDAKNVFDVDSTQQIMIFRKMTDEGRLWGGDEIKNPPRLCIGAATNPFGTPPRMHMLRTMNKLAAGSEFFQTQAVFDLDRFDEWMEDARRLNIHKKAGIIVGIIPLKTVRAAKFMIDNVPGTCVPDSVIERLSSAADPAAEGLRIAAETIEHVSSQKGVAGVHIMPINWYDSVGRLIEMTGLRPSL
ncbi:MAG: methylenetetrahydrofolate reductase [Thermoplasmatales archaeon]|nr:methylenetetrahydrofolate reductase [Thermoplasmatales archaeon]